MYKNNLKRWKFMAIMTGLSVVMMMTFAGLGWADNVDFNFTAKLSWKDYKKVTTLYDAAIWGDGWPGCGSNTQTKEYSQHIPFEQDVTLSRYLLHNCQDTDRSTSYQKDGDSDWTAFTSQTTLHYGGDFKFRVYAKNDPDGNWSNPNCSTKCTVRLSATYYDATATTNQQKVVAQAASLPIKRARQELTRIPVPQSQFENNTGLIRDLQCSVEADKGPDDVIVWCEQQGEDFVVYAYPIDPKPYTGPVKEVDFNYSALLLWKDYKQTTHQHQVVAKDELNGGFLGMFQSCEFNWEHGEFHHNIPFQQNVSLSGSDNSQCSVAITKYVKDGSEVLFNSNVDLNWEGDLTLRIDAKSPYDCKSPDCNVTLSATFYDQTTTTDQQKTIDLQASSILIGSGKKELMRIPIKSQFENPTGVVRDFQCTVMTDKSSEDVITWCEKQENDFVIYGYTVEPVADVWISDPAPDDGSEPGKATTIWTSPDIWVRNTDDGKTEYQNVAFGQDNYVYVRVHNRGALTANNTTVEVYRSGASMGRGAAVIAGNPVILNGWALVGTAEIESLEHGKSVVTGIRWDKESIPNPGHYCFYVRVLNEQDPISYPEENNLVLNTMKNNNIAWRNFNVVGLLNKVTDNFTVNVGNPKNELMPVNIIFDEKENLLNNEGSAVIVDLGVLFQRWQQAGGKGENIKVLSGSTEVRLLATPAKFIGILLEAGEDLPISIRTEAFKPMPGVGTSRQYQFSTQEFINGELIGGVDYAIITRAQGTDSDGDNIPDVKDTDNDNDDMPDNWEIQNGLNLLDKNDAPEDNDNDGATNLQEYKANTNPNDPDSKPIMPEPTPTCTEFQLTRNGNNVGPAWSSDGSKLVFERWDDTTENVFIINNDGSNEKMLTSYSNNRGRGYIGLWGAIFRPNSNQIYYMEDSRGTLWWIRWASEDGSLWDKEVVYVPGGDGFTSPSFSEDGSRLCYIHYSYNESGVRGARREIKIADADGSNVRIIMRDDTISDWEYLAWGKGTSKNKLAYTKLVGGVPCIFTVDTNGSNVTQITDPSIGECIISDFVGDKIFFANKNQVSYVNIHTKKITQITNDSYENGGAVLSPDGKRIAYTSKRDGVYNIYITCDPDSSRITPGVFTVVDSTGIVKIDWLYDGGKYQGEFGIFSLTGMENLAPGSSEFIAEAVKRVMSNSEQGYLVFSDLSEGARYSGILGNEIRDWNAGQYKGLKSLTMKPGDRFATILVPNSTFASLAQNPGTTDSNKRPLFSLVSDNPGYGTHIGQMADINGMGKAFAYEDKDAATSDWDYNDLIVQITGAEASLPTLNSLVYPDKRSKREHRDTAFTDWRVNSELGKLIMAHIEAPAVTEDTLRMTVTLKAPATLLVYDPSGKVIGKEGGTIPGADFEISADGSQTVSLNNPGEGNYRITIQSAAPVQGTLTVKSYQGSAEISSADAAVSLAAHQTMTMAVPADSVSASQPLSLGTPVTATSYDFSGDGITDNADVSMIVKHWNSCRNQQKYDPFYDLNDDGCITVADVMKVLNAKTVK